MIAFAIHALSLLTAFLAGFMAREWQLDRAVQIRRAQQAQRRRLSAGPTLAPEEEG